MPAQHERRFRGVQFVPDLVGVASAGRPRVSADAGAGTRARAAGGGVAGRRRSAGTGVRRAGRANTAATTADGRLTIQTASVAVAAALALASDLTYARTTRWDLHQARSRAILGPGIAVRVAVPVGLAVALTAPF